MKTAGRRILMGSALALAVCMSVARADAYPPFHRDLAPVGNWFRVSTQWVWQPEVAATVPGWKPYFHGGNWEWRDSNWFWASEYTWGAIPFHHGRWWNSPANGWVWVPGTEWRPAWVIWRADTGAAGWTPQPPDPLFFSQVGLDASGVQVEMSQFSFVSYQNFLARDLTTVAVDGTWYARDSYPVASGPAPAMVGYEAPRQQVVYSSSPAVVYTPPPVVVTPAPVYVPPQVYVTPPLVWSRPVYPPVYRPPFYGHPRPACPPPVIVRPPRHEPPYHHGRPSCPPPVIRPPHQGGQHGGHRPPSPPPVVRPPAAPRQSVPLNSVVRRPFVPVTGPVARPTAPVTPGSHGTRRGR